MKASKWKDIVGKRVLLADEHPFPDPAEAEVIELSPSGKFVKVKWASAENAHWYAVDEYDLVEVLN